MVVSWLTEIAILYMMVTMEMMVKDKVTEYGYPTEERDGILLNKG